MKLLFIVFVLVLSPVVSHSQAGNDPEQVIKGIMESGGIEGHDSKVIGPMGDAAAVVLTKVLAGKSLESRDIDGSLWILGQAFAGPGSVKNVSDREPRTALLLLQYFDVSTSDPALKRRIADTRKYIEDHYAKAVGAGGKR